MILCSRSTTVFPERPCDWNGNAGAFPPCRTTRGEIGSSFQRIFSNGLAKTLTAAWPKSVVAATKQFLSDAMHSEFPGIEPAKRADEPWRVGQPLPKSEPSFIVAVVFNCGRFVKVARLMALQRRFPSNEELQRVLRP